MSHTLIFDIGKTNKKCFVFDRDYNELWKEYVRIEEIEDEDGYPCDDLSAIEEWIKTSFEKLVRKKQFDITAVNFSTYGASLVHVDKDGEPVTPLYNYLKPYPKQILQQFYSTHGDKMKLARETASPPLEMLNSGMQLYYLKYAKSQLFRKIKFSLHLPQYLSFLFTKVFVADTTSIGCHTMLWEYADSDYHQWVYEEELDQILPPIATRNMYLESNEYKEKLRIGIGIHDSSAALIPYLNAYKKPFLLISTGTWSVSINPFNDTLLTDDDLNNDSLNFMQISGKMVRASRLFLGNEYKLQVRALREYFNKEEGYHHKVQFDKKLYEQLKNDTENRFKFDSIHIDRVAPEASKLDGIESFELAYHKLMMELVDLQVDSARRAIGNSYIDKIFIDGGFASNDLFVRMLAIRFHQYKIGVTLNPLGSALGAAMMVSSDKVKRKFLKKRYAMQKYN